MDRRPAETSRIFGGRHSVQSKGSDAEIHDQEGDCMCGTHTSISVNDGIARVIQIKRYSRWKATRSMILEDEDYPGRT